MRRTTLFLLALLTGGCAALSPALAQIKPASSGEPSFNEPEMRPHRSGLYRPHRPHHHVRHHRRHRGRPGPGLY